MKTAERVVMVLLLLVIVGGLFGLYYIVTADRAAVRDAVARGEYEIPLDSEEVITEDGLVDQSDWRRYYPVTVPIMIGEVSVAASVADTLPARIKGLSETPYLPMEVVKLFVFESEGNHAIWMKDMNYSIDILWADRDGTIVHIEENVTPETYPESFSSPLPSWYVIEANAGFVEMHEIVEGDQLTIVREG